MKLTETAKLAKEWANEVGRWNASAEAIRDALMWGFSEVDRGRHPTSVLKDMKDRVNANKTDVRLL
ncbi:MAG TPA: hypothetical protein VHT52_17965 [Stellaceae bacterium]|jgi:hypothetical protein|nr:hypothetical protein [Stellaceae bacterium]